MVLVRVEWRVQHAGGGTALLEAYIRDPERRGAFVAGVHCSDTGISVRTEGCTEDAQLLILRDSIETYEEMVM